MPKQQDQQNWKYCGNQIKLWREEAQVSRQKLADETEYSYDYVKSMENGRRRPTLKLLQVADDLFGAKGKLLAGYEFLEPEPFAQRHQDYMDLEAEAIVVHQYALTLIPGLLQTRTYTSALVGASCPPFDDEQVEELVLKRMKRQHLFAQHPRTVYGFVIHEAALRANVGGREAMQQQLLSLLDIGHQRNVSIQVLPSERCTGNALNGPFILLETNDHQRYAYVEAPCTNALHASGKEVSDLTQAHGMIRMQALGVEESAEFIRKLAEEL